MSIMGNLYGFFGYYNHSRGKYKKALDMYERSEKLGIDRPNYLLSYGVLMLREGNFAKAKELFSTVLTDLPAKEEHKTMAKMNISLAYWKLGDIDVAVEMLEEVHRKHRSGKVYGTLGYLLIQKGDLERALEYNLEALDYDEDDPVILDNLGQIYYKMGQVNKAKDFFERAEEEKDDQAVTLYYLGIIYSREGSTEKAREKLNKALTCNITPLSAITHGDIEKALGDLD
ncbi:MAG TPA: tetratricopeptide repeat protein [Clostridia bacterium]|nr:tetratricopeptide repeat protein [Clostridia bacterium]